MNIDTCMDIAKEAKSCGLFCVFWLCTKSMTVFLRLVCMLKKKLVCTLD